MKYLIISLIAILMVCSASDSFARGKKRKKACPSSKVQPWKPKVHVDITSNANICQKTTYKGSRPQFFRKSAPIAPLSGDKIRHGKYPKNKGVKRNANKGDRSVTKNNKRRSAPGNDRPYNPKDWS